MYIYYTYTYMHIQTYMYMYVYVVSCVLTSGGGLQALSKALQVFGQEIDSSHHISLCHCQPCAGQVEHVHIHLQQTTEPRELLNGG